MKENIAKSDWKLLLIGAKNVIRHTKKVLRSNKTTSQ